MYEHHCIIGRVGKDPETRFTSEGKAVLNFSVAVSEKWKDKAGNAKESTTWYKVAVWDKQAESISPYVHKGMLIMVTGKMSASAYIAADGTAKASLEMTAREVKFLSRNDSESDNGGGQQYDDSDPLAEFEKASAATHPAQQDSRDLGDYAEERPRGGGYRQNQQPAASQAPASNPSPNVNMNTSRFRPNGGGK